MTNFLDTDELREAVLAAKPDDAEYRETDTGCVVSRGNVEVQFEPLRPDAFEWSRTVGIEANPLGHFTSDDVDDIIRWLGPRPYSWRST